MANPKFLACDLSVPTYSWSAGTNASYPVSNLKNYFPDIKSRSNANTDAQRLIIDMGSAVSCNAAALHGHNFASLGLSDSEVLLQVNTNDDADWSDAVTVSEITVSPDPIFDSFAATDPKRYWSLYFVKGSALGAAPEIGNIFLGTTLDFEKPQQYGFHTNLPVSVTSKSRSLDGRLRTAQTFGAIRKHRASFKLLTDSFVSSFRTFLALVGNDGLPFYYIDKDSNVYLVNLTKSANPYSVTMYNQNDIVDLEMESTLADT